nr:hypothetical protein 2 [Desulfobacteraceae bacterium]
MVTVFEDIKNKIEKAKKWEEANSELSWCSPEYPENKGKVYITKEILESQAYRSLSKIAMLLYQDFLAKRIMKQIKSNKKKVWVIENNGHIIFPYAEAEERGYSRDQFRNGIDELQRKGFIDITHQGKGGRKPAKGTGDVSRYWIDDRWREYGTDDFRLPRKPRQKDTRQGRGWKLYHDKKQTIGMEIHTR